MNWFYNLKTAHKLAVGFGLCLTLAVLVGTVAIIRMTQMNKISQNIISDSVDGLLALGSAEAGIRQFRTVEFRHVLSFTPAEKAQADTDLAAAQDSADKALTAYQSTIIDPADKQNWAALQTEWQKYVAMKDALLTASRKKRRQAVRGPAERAAEGTNQTHHRCPEHHADLEPEAGQGL